MNNPLYKVKDFIEWKAFGVCSAIGERLIVRALAHTGLALRKLLVPALIELTGSGSLPRLWHL